MNGSSPQTPPPGGSAPPMLGGFRLIELIGRGGMGEVWRAEREGPGGYRRRAAVKRILPRFQNEPTLRARFLSEARISARLEHPNITQVLDFGESPEPFLALEYIEGTTVARVLKVCAETQQRLPPAVAAYIIAEVATGLDYAHRRKDDAGNPLQIVHRDVSPQNVLISTEGGVKISDFGIARAADNLLRTQQGIAVGKLAYMAPEQASGGTVDWRADVFSLGVLLWETLLVRPLIPRNDSNAAIQLLLSGRFEPPSRIDPRVPQQVDAAVMEALQVDPNRRTQSAGLLAQQLRAYLHSGAPGFDGGALVRVVAPLVRDVAWQSPSAPPPAHPSLADGAEPATRIAAEPLPQRPSRPATMAPPTRNAPAGPAIAAYAPPGPNFSAPGPNFSAPAPPAPVGYAPPGASQPMAPPTSPPGFSSLGEMPPAPDARFVQAPVPLPAQAAQPVMAPRKPVSVKWITYGIVALMLGGAGVLFLWLTRSSMAPRAEPRVGPVVAVGADDAGVAAPPPVRDAGAAPAPRTNFRAEADAALIALDPAVRACMSAERTPPEWVDVRAIFDNVSGRVADPTVTFRGARASTTRVLACVQRATRAAHFEPVAGATGTTEAIRSWPGRVAPAPRPRSRPTGGGPGFQFPFGRHR
ncbi:MAG: protein kinase [Polyangiales bacterium]